MIINPIYKNSIMIDFFLYRLIWLFVNRLFLWSTGAIKKVSISRIKLVKITSLKLTKNCLDNKGGIIEIKVEKNIHIILLEKWKPPMYLRNGMYNKRKIIVCLKQLQ